MKSTIQLLMAFVIMGSFTFSVQAQSKVSSGEVKYVIDVSGMDDMTASFLKGATMVTSFDKSHVKVVMDMGMAKTTTIDDLKSETTTTYMDMMGQKYKTVLDTDEIRKEAEEQDDFEVKKTSETKEIAGYTCTKVLVKDKSGATLNFWVTDKIKVNNLSNSQFAKLDGYPLEFDIDQGGMKMSFKAIKVTSKTFDKDFFAPLEGYSEMTDEQMKKMMGGE